MSLSYSGPEPDAWSASRQQDCDLATPTPAESQCNFVHIAFVVRKKAMVYVIQQQWLS